MVSMPGARTQEASHVYCVLKRYATDAIWQYIACVTMHNSVDIGESLVYLAVDMTLEVAWLRVLLDGFSGFDVVLNKIVRRAHKSRRHVAWHPECRSIIRRSHGDVTVRVKDLMAVEYVRGSDKPLEKILKTNLLAFGEVSCRHVRYDG